VKVALHACEVVENARVNARYRAMRLRCPAPLGAATAPGQFFQLACPAGGDEQPFLRRPMSVYGIGPEPGRLEFLYHVKGAGTRALERLRSGERLELFGPLGRGFAFSPSWKRVLFVARGEVALEQQMACGMGVCLSCVRLFDEGGEKVFRRVCCEGPVFPLASVSGEVQFG